jgi:tocopherol O-methyltransferase
MNGGGNDRTASLAPPLLIVPRVAQVRADVSDHYDELDRVYREIWGEHVHHGFWRTGRESVAEATEALIEMVAERLQPSHGARLVDIGCGYGGTARWMAERFGAEVTGFTVSEAQAAYAAAQPVVQGSVSIRCKDWLTNSLPAESTDGAYSIESSEHMIDKPLFLREAWRVLKPGGRLVLCAWLARDRPSRRDIDHLLEPICREGRLPGLGNRAYYEQEALAAGFVLEGYRDIGRQVGRTWQIVATRLARRFVTDPWLRRLILSERTRNRIFLLSIPRLYVALRTGAMPYGVITFVKPAD